MTYKLVIIDDNPTTVKSLSLCFDWEELGITIVGTALDGVQGKELILNTHPDIIITDINMPDIDGLSMIEQLYDEISNAKVIVITGYDEFQYASRAIKLSVFDFILKPIDDDELRSSSVRAIESLEKERLSDSYHEKARELMRRAQLISLLTVSETDENTVKKLVQKYGIEFSSFFMIAAYAKNGISQPLLRHIDSENIPEGLSVVTLIIEDTLVVLCMYNAEDEHWKKAAERLSARILSHEPELSIAVSGLHHSYHHIRDAYQEAKWILIENRLINTNGFIRFFGDEKCNTPKNIVELENKCRELVYDINQAEVLFHEIYKKMLSISNEEILSMRLILFYYCKMIVNEWLPKQKRAEFLDTYLMGVININSANEACTFLQTFFNKIEKISSESSEVSALVRKVLYYITMHAIEGLRLEDVAEKFYVSPNYLSSLIKKETGVKYQQHVLTAKIGVAKQMLDDTRMRVEEIAHAVGYENYVSFYNTFKRLEGKTPTEYRLRCSVE